MSETTKSLAFKIANAATLHQQKSLAQWYGEDWAEELAAECIDSNETGNPHALCQPTYAESKASKFMAREAAKAVLLSIGSAL